MYIINRQIEKIGISPRVPNFIKKHPYTVFAGALGTIGGVGGAAEARNHIQGDIAEKGKKSSFHKRRAKHKENRRVVYAKKVLLGVVTGGASGAYFASKLYGSSGYSEQGRYNSRGNDSGRQSGSSRGSSEPTRDDFGLLGIDKDKVKTLSLIHI